MSDPDSYGYRPGESARIRLPRKCVSDDYDWAVAFDVCQTPSGTAPALRGIISVEGWLPLLTGRREAEPTGEPSAAATWMRPLFRSARSR